MSALDGSVGPGRLPGRALVQPPRPARRGLEFWNRIEAGWACVQEHCEDHESQRRLEYLQRRLRSDHRGVRESAIAELELAAALVRTGSRIVFLPESCARTADLACIQDQERLFVEITAMVGAYRRAHGIPSHRALFLHNPDGPLTDGDVLIHRILARIGQKARQLSDYAAPVMLAVSVPPRGEEGTDHPSKIKLDLRRLAGAITTLLLSLTHVSGVLLSLWDIMSLPASSAVRLANVGLVERNRHQPEYPPVRLLVRNPTARAPLSRGQDAVLRQIL